MPISTMSAWSASSWQLPVVMLHGEVQRVDAAEIFGVEHVLRADPAPRRRAEIGLEDGQHRLQHRHAGQPHRRAALVDLPRQSLVDHRIEHDARLLLDVLEHLHQLLFGADQRIDVLDRARVLVLRRRRAAGGKQRLAGRVRDQMQMEEALRFGHPSQGCPGRLWPAVDKMRAGSTSPAGRLYQMPRCPQFALPWRSSDALWRTVGIKPALSARHKTAAYWATRQVAAKPRENPDRPQTCPFLCELAPVRKWRISPGALGTVRDNRFPQSLRIRKQKESLI